MEQDDWDKWKLSKNYSWTDTSPHVGHVDNNHDYIAEIYKQIREHRLEVNSSIVNKNSTAVSSSNTKPKPKIKVDVSHMSKDVGADILQRVKQAYEDTNV